MSDVVEPAIDEQRLAHVRHELRTPLNAILGYSEMLLEEIDDRGLDDLSPDLIKVREAGARLLVMIDQHLRPGGTLFGGESEQAHPTVVKPTATDVDVEISLRPTITGRLLVVDDVEGNRDVLERHLVRQGHTVVAVSNGHDALLRVRTEPFDVVLLDVMMPEMDGFEVLERLKADPDTRDIPILMISALDQLDSVVKCIERGAEDFLPKPFNPILLRARIGASLEQKRLRDQELQYLRSVQAVTSSAASLESGAFDPSPLHQLTQRTDELGALARVFTRMGEEVQRREMALRRQLEALKIEVDAAKRQKQVSEVTETDYFRDLQAKAREIRQSRKS